MQFPIIYLHIPKTAGTSFRKSAEQYFGPQFVLNDYGQESNETSDDIRGAMYDNKDIEVLRSNASKKKFLTGHFEINAYREVFPDSPVVTFLRDPLERIISEFIHFSTHYNFEGSLPEFYRRPHFQNRQSRALSGVCPTDLDYYGITEDYENSLNNFNQKFATRFPLAVLNRGKYDGGIREIATPEQIEEITTLNRVDIEMYNYALEHFDSQDKSPVRRTVKTARYNGILGGVRENKLIGWTIDRESDQAAEITIAVNGEKRMQGVANLYREDIRKKGLHINGNCGFAVPLDMLGVICDGDELSVITSDGSFELPNSPLKLSA